MLTVNSTINLAGQAVPNIIPAVQGDTGRVIVFTLADFTIPAGSTATYYVQKPSGEAVYNSATIDGNKVTVELTAQSLAETGDNYGQVRILNGEDVVTSFDFILLVKPFRGIGAIESTTEMNIFDEAVQNAMAQFDSMLPDIIAPEFDSSTEYEAGSYVIYGGKLYQFTSGHAAGAWTGADADETMVTEKLGGGSGDGLTDDIKQALLQIAQKVAYVDEDGQDYYDALYDALYPPADLVSISAVYTQSGTVYDTDTLDSLKDDLVVTAHYSDQTSETVTTYTLSGTLTEGTSTITVTYGGKTDTFDVVVSEAPTLPIYNWDLKTSLTDTVSAAVATINNNATRTQGTGVVFTVGNGYVNYGEVYARNRTYEIDVAALGTGAATNQNRRLLAFATSANTGSGGVALVYRPNNGWRFYTGSAWDTTALTGTDGQTIFDGKTVKFYLDSNGYAHVSYKDIGADDSTYIHLGDSTSTMKDFESGGHVYHGGSTSDSLASATISGLRIYEGEK